MTTRSTELLRAVHRHPGITRADAARLLGIGTGAATELVTKLSRALLLTQAPAAPSGSRGRPTTVLLPHPDGPLVLALAITHEAWRLDVVELGGATITSRSERHEHAPWAEVRGAVAAAVKELHARYGPRLRAIGISVPGPVTRSLRLDAFTSDWHGIDLTELWPTDASSPRPTDSDPAARTTDPAARSADPAARTADPAARTADPADARTADLTAPTAGPADAPTAESAEVWPSSRAEAGILVAGNDATLAATAEHLHGATASVALHLRIESGLGGALIEDGRPVIGARNTAGEFGHMPFGDPDVKCACGANGCWGTSIDGTALARLLNAPPPRDPVTYARRVIATASRAHRSRQDLADLPPRAVLSSAPLPDAPDGRSGPDTRGPVVPPAVDSEAPEARSHSSGRFSAYSPDATAPRPAGKAATDSATATASHHPSGETSSYSSGEAGPEIDPDAALEAVETVGTALGRGIAGLVNALDPDLITLGGIGPDLLAAAPGAITTAYHNGLMIIHRDSPPPILPATLPDDEGPITGAAEEAWTALFPRLT